METRIKFESNQQVFADLMPFVGDLQYDHSIPEFLISHVSGIPDDNFKAIVNELDAFLKIRFANVQITKKHRAAALTQVSPLTVDSTDLLSKLRKRDLAIVISELTSSFKLPSIEPILEEDRSRIRKRKIFDIIASIDLTKALLSSCIQHLMGSEQELFTTLLDVYSKHPNLLKQVPRVLHGSYATAERERASQRKIFDSLKNFTGLSITHIKMILRVLTKAKGETVKEMLTRFVHSNPCRPETVAYLQGASKEVVTSTLILLNNAYNGSFTTESFGYMLKVRAIEMRILTIQKRIDSLRNMAQYI